MIAISVVDYSQESIELSQSSSLKKKDRVRESE